MRFKSSGLGEEMELKCHMTDVVPAGEDLLVMHLDTTDPVQWHLKAAIQFHDILPVLKGIIKPSVLFFIIRCFFWVKKEPREPKTF